MSRRQIALLGFLHDYYLIDHLAGVGFEMHMARSLSLLVRSIGVLSMAGVP